MTRSEEILCKIAYLNTEVETDLKEIKTLKKELKEIAMKETERIMAERKERADKMAGFIRHNTNRTLVAVITWPEITNEGEYLGEVTKEHILKKGEYSIYKTDKGDWSINKPGEFQSLLECIDNIYVRFE